MPKSRPVLERFWEKVEEDPETGCWNWTASTRHGGYGQFGITPKIIVRAHRFSYEYMVGPIPEGLELDHLCRNPRCVNPDHLDPVPHIVNVQRGDIPAAKVRWSLARTHCKNGHELTADNTRSTQGRRFCRACTREAMRRHRARKKAA